MLKKVLGASRWADLTRAIQAGGDVSPSPLVGTLSVTFAIAIAILPGVITHLCPIESSDDIDLPTLTVGLCALISLHGRSILKIPYQPITNWKKSISLTHTAVAFGCIPAVFILALKRDVLANRGQVLNTIVQTSAGHQQIQPTFWTILLYAAAVAAWAAITEEVIYRSFLLCVLRRWKVLSSQKQRDKYAVAVSALIFGLVHYSTWGPFATIALVGLGLGFVLAYIANGEKLVPLILYHFAFDFLSIAVGMIAVAT